MTGRRATHALASAVLAGGLMTGGALAHAAGPCSPCSARDRKGWAAQNPCAANPCAAKHPCAARNPCAASNPCAARNPCAPASPCQARAIRRPAGYTPYRGDHGALSKAGEALFKDPALSTNGMSCNTCHVGNAAYGATFSAPYPHRVAMAESFGMRQIHLDEMVQLCMLGPMAAKPLDWKSRELAALVAYTETQQKTFKPSKATSNPCAAKSAGAAKR